MRDPARSNSEKSTLLIEAITNGLDNVNAQDRLKGTGMEKWSILHHAVHLDSPAALKAVLDAPHIKLHTIDKSGGSPLHLAAKCGNDSAVASLLDKQRQLHPDDAKTLAQYANATNQACRTPMHLAATAPQGVKVMQRLFDAGGTVDPSTRTGLSTPLSYAVKAFRDNRAQSLEASRWLISKGANAETPLLINKTNRSVMAAEARQNVKSNFTSPLNIAKENNWSSLVRVLDPTTPTPIPSTSPQLEGSSTPGRYVDPVGTMTLEEEFSHALATNPGKEVIQSYAIRLCSDCFDKEASLRNCFYASEDPYYIAMDLRNNEGLDTNDVDSLDTLRDCRERFVEGKTSWIEAAMDTVCENIREHVSSPPKDLSEAYAELRTRIDSFFSDEAYGLMQETIRAQFGNPSDSD
ncbi:ankyrin repeat domain-containing protein [uncultured Stenotrophomonas sp.]|uniref:ankyrin repeat domain-containing protein n=1 Tax=uncultured Stenotrophomonas sp. TaxID=165438 RepID=UPI0028EEDE7A|nr:ankyrin repeat domain-containing protein [uncultured Stenotrophomonas sp.]